MVLHKDQIGINIHAIIAKTYADLTARDADTIFNTDAANVDKTVRVNSPLSYYVLTSTAPAWVEFSGTATDSFIKLPDTPTTYVGQAGKVLEVNAAENAIEFGQKLRTTDSPQFTDLTLTGDLTVQGATTTIDTTTLLVEDKNIEMGVVATPTDVTADGGGITLKGTTDKTINWVNATNAWSFNQSIDLLGKNLITSNGNILAGTGFIGVGNLILIGNDISSTSGDLNITTQSGGVFKFVDNALRSGLDASNYLEFGHGGSNSFINHVGDGEMDFRFGGVNKASFTTAGHLHLKTDVDQKHTLKIITANNLNDTGMAFENSGGSFTHTIFRTDVGSNRADLVFAAGLNTNIDLLTNSFKIHGEASDEGKLEVIGALQISSGSPAVGNVLTSDANGLTTWEIPSPTAGGWTDDGTVVRLTTSTDDVVIGRTGTADAKLEVNGTPGATVGGFPSGQFHVTSPSTSVNGNSVITGHNSFNTNTQLWYLGSTSSSNQDIGFINRQNANLFFSTNDTIRVTITDIGNVEFENKIQIKGGNAGDTKVLTSDAVGNAVWAGGTVTGQFSHSVSQKPADNTPISLAFNTDDITLKGITHSTTVQPEEFTATIQKVYTFMLAPQWERISSGGTRTIDFWMQISTDGGTVFTDVANSNVKVKAGSNDSNVIPLMASIALDVNDIIRFQMRISAGGDGLGTVFTAAEVGPPTIPATPSQILTIFSGE